MIQDEKWENYSSWHCEKLECSHENYTEYVYREGAEEEKSGIHTEDEVTEEEEVLSGQRTGRREKGFLRCIGEKMIDLVYPPATYCIMCDSVIDGTRKYNMCDECIGKFLWAGEETCHICGKVLTEEGVYICDECAQRDRAFDRGFTCTAYGLYERKLISDFKQNRKVYLARIIGRILYDRIVIEDLKIDGIIPIPIHNEKMKIRGFNQTELMGRYLSERSGWKLLKNIVVRSKETASMKKLDRWERASNMEGAFSLKNPEKIRGKNILVIDDISTTYATLEECSRVLKQGGAQKVYILTFASGR